MQRAEYKKGQEVLDMQIFPDNRLRNFRQLYHPFLHSFQIVRPKTTCTTHYHYTDDFACFIPMNRSYHGILNGHKLTIRKGEFLLRQPGQSYLDLYSEKEPFYYMNFSIFEDGSKKELQKIFSPEVLPPHQVAKLPENLSKECLSLMYKAGQQHLSEHICSSFFITFFWLIMEAFPAKDLFRDLNRSFENNIQKLRICDFFEKSLPYGKLDAPLLAKTLNVSARTLSRICFDIFGAPTARAFQNFRCMSVRQFLLENPGISIKETAEHFHFPDTFSLSRHFRNHFGYPPSKLADKLSSDTNQKNID